MIRTIDIAWAAGFLEGEGNFANNKGKNRRRGSLAIVAAQVQREPLERLKKIFGGGLVLKIRNKTENGSDYHRWQVGGTRAAEIMMTIYGLMSPRRRGQIDLCLQTWKLLRTQRKANSKFCIRGHNLSEHGALGRRGDKTIIRYCRKCRADIYAGIATAQA